MLGSYEKVIEDRKKVLSFINHEVNGMLDDKYVITEEDYHNKELTDDFGPIEIFKQIIKYLKEEDYLRKDTAENECLLTSKGLNEVLKKFPTLDHRSSQITELRNFISGLDKNDAKIMEKLNEMQQWENVLINMDTQITLIKAQLDQVLVQTEDDEIKEIVRDVISSKSATQFITGIFRLAVHPKTKEYMKSILGIEITSKELPKLPGGARI